jgi:hypothetical protein
MKRLLLDDREKDPDPCDESYRRVGRTRDLTNITPSQGHVENDSKQEKEPEVRGINSF